MSGETFLFALVLGAGALALWVVVRFPRLGPVRLSWAILHVAAACLVASLLDPGMRLVGAESSGFGLAVAVFGLALPGLTYMFLAGAWLIRVALAAASLRS